MLAKPKPLLRELAIYENKSLLNFTSNDYLNLSSHPEVKKAFIAGVEKYGLGSGASPQVSGYTYAHQSLEEQFADFLGREKALLFNSGYHANVGVIPVLANRSSTIFSDKLCHASLLDGILLSRAKHVRYPHLRHPRESGDLLEIPAFAGMTREVGMTRGPGKTEAANNALIITESIFSMEGDIADVKTLSTIKKSSSAKLLVDDAHGIGVLGKNGRGIIEHTEINHEIDCLVTPLGKALGSLGAIVSGSKEMIDEILQSARTHRYSTAIPAANCVGTLAALTLLRTEAWRREKLKTLAEFFIHEADKRNLTLTSCELTPIKSILIGSNEQVMVLQKKLLQTGILIAAIRPPTVPENTARIRVSLNCEHSVGDIVRLLDQLAENLC